MKLKRKSLPITSLNFNQLLVSDVQCELKQFENINSKDIQTSIDRLDIKSNGLNEDWIAINLKFFKWFSDGSYYKCIIYTDYREREIKILRNNRSKKAKYLFKVELNPNHFSSFNDVKNTLNSIVGIDNMINHKISRIDISFTFPIEKISIRAFHLSTFVKHKQVSGNYFHVFKECKKNSIRTLDIGKRPHRVTVYDRSTKKKNPEDRINFEIQFSNKKVFKLMKGEKLEDLNRLSTSNPLKKIYFKDISRPMIKVQRISTVKKIESFVYSTVVNGHQVSRNDYNTNFLDKYPIDIMPRFKIIKASNNVSLKKELISIFRNEMRSYLSSDTDNLN